MFLERNREGSDGGEGFEVEETVRKGGDDGHVNEDGDLPRRAHSLDLRLQEVEQEPVIVHGRCRGER
jgi:hypothetical protein